MKTFNAQLFQYIITIDQHEMKDEHKIHSEAVISEFISHDYQISFERIIGSIDIASNTIDALHSYILKHSLPIKIAIARNNELAEIALLWSDGYGITFIMPEEEDTYLAGIPIDELPQISRLIAKKLRKFQVFTAYDLKYSNTEFLRQTFDRTICDIHSQYNSKLSRSINETINWCKQVRVAELKEFISTIKLNTHCNSRGKDTDKDNSIDTINLFNYQLVPAQTIY